MRFLTLFLAVASVYLSAQEPRGDTIAATAAAVAGLGIASVSLWNCRSELESGALVQVLADWQMELEPLDGDQRRVTVHALTDHGRKMLAELT